MSLKKLLFGLIFGAFSMLCAVDELNSTQDVNSSNKIIFLYIDSDTCEFCRKLDRMLDEPKVAELLENYFTIKRELLNDDLELPKGLPLPYGTPTVYFLNSKGEAIIEPMRGEKTKKELLDFLNEAIDEQKRMKTQKRNKPKNLWERLFGD
jgi:thiol-disulfide isomerase/thioredoxin